MGKEQKNLFAPIWLDLFAAVLIGLLAGLFATIVTVNLDFLGNTFKGVELTIPLIFGFFVVLCIVGIFGARILGRAVPLIYKFGKFGEAGGLNWLVDLGVLNLLILLTGFSTGFYFVLYKGISFVSASTNSYFWNKFWVFRGAKKQDETKEVGKFALATILGMLVNITLAGIIAYVGPLLFPGLGSKAWANIATITGSLTAMIFNFVLYKIWVFKN